MNRPSPITFAVPETVEGYLSDAALRTGIDALLKVPPDDLPPDLGLEEVVEYLAARSAAEVVRYDYAAVLHSLWWKVWGGSIPADWTPATIATALEGVGCVTPDDCWNEQAMTIFHKRGPLHLHTAVGVAKKSTSIAFSLELEDGSILMKDGVGPFVPADDDGWTDWLMLVHPSSLVDASFDLQELQRHAAQAIAQVISIADSHQR